MKSLGSSDSLGAMMSLCPNSTDGDDQVNNNTMYRREFQTVLDGLDEEGCCVDESGSGREKKRRLEVDQVKALEKNFEVENKLEPERKLKLAQELGLQPRQVAVWFQNRRARWKTKQLERDYGVLKNNYDGLKISYEKLQRDNEALLKEIKELKSKLSDDRNCEDSAKEEEEEEEVIVSDTEEKANLATTPVNSFPGEMKTEDFSDHHHHTFLCGSSILVYDFKDGSSDSDSSAILNEDNANNDDSPINTDAAAAAIHNASMNMNIQFLSPSSSSSSKKSADVNNGDQNGQYQKVYDQFVKIEEHNFESCTNLFSDDQAPSLPWYCSEEWS